MTELYLLPKPGEILQGDIFEEMPSTRVESRPLRVARHYKPTGNRDIWQVHLEDADGPQGGFSWQMDQGGEGALLVHAFLGRAMVISHDCEIENDPTTRTLAMIRPLTHLDENAQEALFSEREESVRYGVFPLESQTSEPTMERSFVDFRRLTTVRPAVLEASTRVASLSEELRAAIAEAFWLYLFRKVATAAEDLP